MISQFLTFCIQNTRYAVDVSQVQEILEYSVPVKLPCTIDYVEGLISSRGEGISVVNLRKKFAIEDCEITKNTRIIILEISFSDGNEKKQVITFGAIVDSVDEVVEIDASCVEPAPKFGNTIPGEYIRGIGKKDDEFIIILDIDKVFSFEEIAALKAVKQ